MRKLITSECLFWGLSTSEIVHLANTARLLSLKKRASEEDRGFDWEEAADTWLEKRNDEPDRTYALESLAWCHALPHLPTRLSEATWFNVLSALVTRAFTGPSSVNPEGAVGSVDGEQALCRLIFQSELPMVLAYVLSDLKGCRAIRDRGRSRFAALIDELTDGQGTPHASQVRESSLLLASATRTLILDRELKKGKVQKTSRLQFDWLARQTLRWARPNGTTLLKESADSPYAKQLMDHTLALTGDVADQAAFRLASGKGKSSPDIDLPDESEHSEWSEVALMRSAWKKDADRLAIDYSKRGLAIDLAHAQQTVLLGDATPRVLIDGQVRLPSTDWEELCWESDQDMDYLEIECSLGDGWKIQRQFLLARQEKFAFFADAVLGEETAGILYRQPLPLAEGLSLDQAEETNEVTILNSKKVGRIIPLSLPEWLIESRTDRLRCDPARLEIETSARALYAPLFIDLDPKRSSKALTWRRLTVAENLTILPADAAVAFRLQVGKQQWVFYRSLDPSANRTFLGQNLISEFLAARFNTDGEVEPLIDIAG